MHKLITVLLVVFYLTGCADYRRDAREQVRTVINIADSSIDRDTGKYITYESVDIDPWGNALQVTYTSEDQATQYIYVRSAGPDGVYETGDDIVARRGNLVPVAVGRGIRQIIRGAFKDE